MYKGIYIAASGAVLKQQEMDVLTQNLANADTVGFKKETLAFSSFLLDASAAGTDGRTMATLSAQTVDFSGGNLSQTGNKLDVAVQGDGFIGIEGNRFTRRGDLRIDKEGYLTAYNGAKVLGSGGPIQLPDKGEVSINELGVVAVDGSEIDRIMVRDFPDKGALVPAGGGLYVAAGEGVESSATVRQGALERSNVEVVAEMVRMIDAVRQFEFYQRMIRTFDEAAEKVNAEMAQS